MSYFLWRAFSISVGSRDLTWVWFWLFCLWAAFRCLVLPFSISIASSQHVSWSPAIHWSICFSWNLYVDRFLLAPPLMGSTSTLFNFAQASSALNDSASEWAVRNSAKVEETHLLQCLRRSGGISDRIFNLVLLAILILAEIRVRSVCERSFITRVNSRVSLLHFLHNWRPLASRLSLPHKLQHLRSPKVEVACNALVLSISFAINV